MACLIDLRILYTMDPFFKDIVPKLVYHYWDLKYVDAKTLIDILLPNYCTKYHQWSPQDTFYRDLVPDIVYNFWNIDLKGTRYSFWRFSAKFGDWDTNLYIYSESPLNSASIDMYIIRIYNIFKKT